MKLEDALAIVVIGRYGSPTPAQRKLFFEAYHIVGDRAKEVENIETAPATDELIERVALALFHDDKPFAKASNLIPTSEELEPWRSSARAAINAITAPSPEMQETGMQGVRSRKT